MKTTRPRYYVCPDCSASFQLVDGKLPIHLFNQSDCPSSGLEVDERPTRDDLLDRARRRQRTTHKTISQQLEALAMAVELTLATAWALGEEYDSPRLQAATASLSEAASELHEAARVRKAVSAEGQDSGE